MVSTRPPSSQIHDDQDYDYELEDDDDHYDDDDDDDHYDEYDEYVDDKEEEGEGNTRVVSVSDDKNKPLSTTQPIRRYRPQKKG